MKRLLIWGASDQAVVTLDCAQAMQMYGQIDLMGITTQKIRRFAQHRVMMEENVIHAKLFHAYDEVIVATGDNRLRQIRLQILEEYGIPIATIIHPSAIISPTAQVNCGSTILTNAVIHTLARIGTGCIINTGAIVEHDCVIKDFVNMSPNCAMAGHCSVESRAFLGIGSTLSPAVTIGEDAVIGAGAVVLTDIPAHATAVGVPAKIIKQRD
ncbi:acetyltransferase [[Clostridium] innocuum]|nr:acetyltransferase [Erysipelotrichaceae bacterium]MCR0381516.1 acetyltransferase [[Clostridium] innocuum]MCR0413607.1 acetyltransferase [[Clostridium] innocuum]MCR0532863.1 acetyltransferase [[Clostridium] innocuum]MCR0536923.1 acetyltransferase [[Clostridium] innocuum]